MPTVLIWHQPERGVIRYQPACTAIRPLPLSTWLRTPHDSEQWSPEISVHTSPLAVTPVATRAALTTNRDAKRAFDASYQSEGRSGGRTWPPMSVRFIACCSQ